MTRYLIILPAVLLAAAVALVIWATSVETHMFDDWQEMYD